MTDWKLAYHANCWGALGGNAVGVTSITQLSYRTFGEMDRAFSDIAAAGYGGVEVFDGNLLDVPAADMRRMLADAGLTLDEVQQAILDGFERGSAGTDLTIRALATVSGAVLAIGVQLLVTLIGMSWLMLILADGFELLRWAGVAYLVYLGVQQWRAPAADAGAPA